MKRLENMEKNKNKNNNGNDKRELSSIRSELSTKTLTSDDDELEKSVCFRDVANMNDTDHLDLKNETETSSYYLNDKINELF